MNNSFQAIVDTCKNILERGGTVQTASEFAGMRLWNEDYRSEEDVKEFLAYAEKQGLNLDPKAVFEAHS